VVHGRFDRAPFGLCELSRARARCREAERDAEHGGENLRESKADTEPLSCEQLVMRCEQGVESRREGAGAAPPVPPPVRSWGNL
jgi:hypothetical protein